MRDLDFGCTGCHHFPHEGECPEWNCGPHWWSRKRYCLCRVRTPEEPFFFPVGPIIFDNGDSPGTWSIHGDYNGHEIHGGPYQPGDRVQLKASQTTTGTVRLELVKIDD